MGCCPSKQKAASSADAPSYSEYTPTKKINADVTQLVRPGNAAVPENDAAASVQEAPSTMLMDRGDGCAIERSDHEANNDTAGIVVVVQEDNQIHHGTAVSLRPAETTYREQTAAVPSIDLRDETSDTVSRSMRPSLSTMAPSTMAPSPVRSSALSSPSKTPINFEDMPINSMYHRIHVVEVEEMEAKRRQALREEAERREREVQEFKAAVLAANEG